MWSRWLAGVVVLGVGALGACSGPTRDFAESHAGAAGESESPIAGSGGAVGGSAGAGGGSAGTGADAPLGGDAGAGPDCGDTQSDARNCGRCGRECDTGQTCMAGECTSLPDHCKDHQTNEDETDEDCGGSCAPCAEGQACAESDGCDTGFCSPELKCAVPSCTDGSQNGYETGPDCGGNTCRDLNLRCLDGEGCAADPDCKNGFCNAGKCASPTCTDELQNQGETYIDCGGPVCRLNISPLGTCSNGKPCVVHGDCTSQYCKDAVCTKATCEDGAKNQDETGLDCGGPTCRGEANGKCGDGEGCGIATDCASGFCSTGKLCSPAGCGNGAKDLNETDIDCGGDDCRATKPCSLGKVCVIHADCASGSCKSGKCVAATCGDGLKNQDETDVDCGGATCVGAGKTCANTLICTKHSDCTDGFCSNGKCSGACKGKPPTLGCPCSPDGRLACAGAAQKLRLACGEGSWVSNNACGASDNCTQADGVCRPVVAACAGKTEGYTYCEQSDVLRACGADLVSASSMTCAGTCKAGACVAASCGDGKQQSNEECDDGNAVAGDGCEPTTCTKSAVVALALGYGHSCALLNGGYVRCWGDNQYGQLGQGNAAFQADHEPYQLPVIDLGGAATAIASGRDHACALLADGSVRCWGRNQSGQLGLGNATAQLNVSPKAIGAIKLGEKATAISASLDSTCALLASKTVRCWGANGNGELGLGNTLPQSSTKTPDQLGPVSLGATAQAVVVGGNHSCAWLTTGGVRCWGNNDFGQLGIGNTTTIGDTELPSASGAAGLVPLPSGRSVAALGLGQVHSCARLDNGSLQCWGDNFAGELGLLHFDNIGDDESPAAFGQTLTGGSISSVVTGELHTCALYSSSGELRCWGYNAFGQLGQPDIMTKSAPSQLSAVALGSGQKASVVSGGTSHTCVLLTNGNVRCWGSNEFGQLGFGSVSTGSKKYVGGDASSTPDKLAAIRVLPP